MSRSEARQILLIDGEKAIQEVTQLCLETVANCEVLTANSGSEGIVKAKTERVDAILLDLDEAVFDMDWLTIFQNLQRNPATQHIPVILLTATLQAKDLPQLTQMGARKVISKSFDLLTLASQIAAVLNWS